MNILLIDDDRDNYMSVRDLIGRISSGSHNLDWVSYYDTAAAALLSGLYEVALVARRLGARDCLKLVRETVLSGCPTTAIIITSRAAFELDAKAMDSDAFDFLIKGQIEAVDLDRCLRHALYRQRSEAKIRALNAELSAAYEATIEGWARAMELRDRDTEGHSRRVADLTVLLCQSMGFGPAELVHIRRGALLHDLGKMGIPDSIMSKAGPLTDKEMAIMRRHPELAVEMLEPIDYLREAISIPWCHHERWDGCGYPRGLSGEQIPLEARAFAAVDIWDALSHDRPYRGAWPRPQVLQHLRDEMGRHLDPQVVETLLPLLSSRS